MTVSGLVLGVEKRESSYIGISYALDSGQQGLFMNPPMAHQNLPQNASGLNPIDRLYSMQSSYFCGEDESMME